MDLDEGYSGELPSARASALPSEVSSNPLETSQDQFSGLESVPNITALDQYQRGELALQLLASLDHASRSQVAHRLLPMFKVDIIGKLPSEIGIQVLYHLPVVSLLRVSQVNRRWNQLSNAQVLWKNLCLARRWRWKSTVPQRLGAELSATVDNLNPQDVVDEGFNDDERFGQLDHDDPNIHSIFPIPSNQITGHFNTHRATLRLSAPPSLPSTSSSASSTGVVPDWKLLFKTRTLLRRRRRHGQYSLRILNAPYVDLRASLPSNITTLEDMFNSLTLGGHMSTIYSLCLANDIETGEPCVFTASRDQSVLQWSLDSGIPSSSQTYYARASMFSADPTFIPASSPMRTFRGVHSASVLSICVSPAYGYLISGGSDAKLVFWDLKTSKPLKVLVGAEGHTDSILHVRCDDERGLVVTAGKDSTVRTFSLRTLAKLKILRSHRAAVNALALSEGLIASVSGDRSLRVWDAETGDLLRVYEGHHTRGLASVDFAFPYIATGSSDRQIRYFQLSTSKGWFTDEITPIVLTNNGHGPNANGNVAANPAATQVQQHHLIIPPIQVIGDPQHPQNAVPSQPHWLPGPIPVNSFAGPGRSSSRPTSSLSSNPHLQLSTASGPRRPLIPAASWRASSTTLPLSHRARSTWKRAALKGLAHTSSRSPLDETTDGHESVFKCPTCKGTGVHSHFEREFDAGSDFDELPGLEEDVDEIEAAAIGATASVGRREGYEHNHLPESRHTDLVRAVAISEDVVVSGSYDATLKIWDRHSGAFLANLANGHTRRIISLAIDCTKIVSCGDDQRICVWDFAWDLDTSFIDLSE